MDRKSAGELQAHMLGTYFTLRVTLAVVGFALPVVAAAAGWLQCDRLFLGPSISSYYHLTARFAFLTARDLFVGGLLAAATCLYAYKGFSTRENVALNLSALFAVGVALLPTRRGDPAHAVCLAPPTPGLGPDGIRPYLHVASAVLFFLGIAYVSLRRSRDTLRLLPDPGARVAYARAYFVTGALMVASPLAAVALSWKADGSMPRVIFLLETFAVWAFAAYWAVKTREMRATRADRRTADGAVERAAVPAEPPPRAVDRAIRRVMVPGRPVVERVVPVGAEALPEGAPRSAPAAPRGRPGAAGPRP
jgi:hypothetical protein